MSEYGNVVEQLISVIPWGSWSVFTGALQLHLRQAPFQTEKQELTSILS